VDAFSEEPVSDNWPVDKAGLKFMSNITVCFGMQCVLLRGNLSVPGAVLSFETVPIFLMRRYIKILFRWLS
jgi:hypothetical protein